MAKKRKAPPPDFLNPHQEWHGYHFTPIFDIMLRSKAYKKLSYPERSLYLYMLSKYNGSGKEFECTFAELVEEGYRKTSISKYINDLVRYGFVEIVKQGRSHNKTIYRFSVKWYTDIPP